MTSSTEAALPDLATEHERLCAAVRAAGDAVRKRVGAAGLVTWEKADRTPVSVVDLEANDILHAHLREGSAIHRRYGWLSEESADDLCRLDAPRTWVVDPIDGTRAFLAGKPEFAVCAALVEDGRAVASAVYNPITHEFFEAVRGGGARCNGEAISVSRADTLERSRMIVRRNVLRHPGWPTPWPDIKTSYLSSTCYRIALVARGDYDSALALLPKHDWDVAPGALIAEEAGACASDHHGTAFQFNKPDPRQRALVCAAPSLYPQLMERLGHLPRDLLKLNV